MKSPRLGVTLSLSHDNGGSRPRLLNDKIDEIDEILAFCSAIDAVDGEMSWNALIDQAHSAHPWSTARMPGWQLLCSVGIVDKQFYQDLLDQISDGVNFVNRDGRITPWNHGAERITGYAASGPPFRHSC
ncbi:MAG TPA: PAS domain S-box protein [Dermatophilaceae bacterium]